MAEKIAARPRLFIGIRTRNIVMQKGSEYLYVKVVSDLPDLIQGKVKYFPMVGAKRSIQECQGMVAFNGDIDDETLANILIYGSL